MTPPAEGLVRGADGVDRCWWCGDKPDYVAYHDTEWGRPVGDDIRLFEKLCLEGFQSGLSWLTILRKRENFRAAFAGFDFRALVGWGERDVERLLGDAGIVRHRGKIEAALSNARRAVDLIDEAGSLARFFWSFEPAAADRPHRLDYAAATALTQTAASRALSRALKQRGWRFVGPTTMYALMQAMGIVNDHLEGCAVRAEVEAERAAFARP
ncbi:MAG: DNA-3-methyladenine glycosylase I [Pseudomonadota bacterium]